MASEVADNYAWNRLPMSILVNIFCYLPLADRQNASRACETWLQAFESPVLWRSWACAFCISEEESIFYSDICNNRYAVLTATEFGRWFKYLIINIDLPLPEGEFIRRQVEVSLGYLTEFFAILTRADNGPQLKTLSFEGDWPNGFDSAGTQEAILAMTRFLRTQKHMTSFASDLYMTVLNGCLLLDAISLSCFSTMKILDIRNFFDSKVKRDTRTAFRYLSCYNCLTTLMLSYRDLGKDVLRALSQNCRNTLKSLYILVDFSENGTLHTIPSIDWLRAKLIVPRLRVKITLVFFTDIEIDTIREVLPSEVPVINLKAWGSTAGAQCIHYYSRNFSQTLQNISLLPGLSSVLVTDNELSLDGAILSLVTSCSKLRSLYFFGTIKLETVKDLIELRIKAIIGLKKLFIRLTDLSSEESQQLVRLREHYNYLIKTEKLIFDFTLLSLNLESSSEDEDSEPAVEDPLLEEQV